MKLKEAIESIHAPKGVTTVIAGVMSGDYSVLEKQNGLDADHETVKAKIKAYTQQLNDCKSDWAYWGILGDLTYWEAIGDILEAAKIVGPDNLPNVAAPELGGVVMDSIGRVGDFGKEILRRAKQEQVKA